MNDTVNIAKGIQSSDHPLTIFLLVLFLVAGTATWRWGSRIVSAIELLAAEGKAFLVKQTEILGSIKNELASSKTELRIEITNTKVELDKRIDGTRDEIVDRIEVTRETIVREIRDDKYRTLANEIRESNPDSKVGRASRPDR